MRRRRPRRHSASFRGIQGRVVYGVASGASGFPATPYRSHSSVRNPVRGKTCRLLMRVRGGPMRFTGTRVSVGRTGDKSPVTSILSFHHQRGTRCSPSNTPLFLRRQAGRNGRWFQSGATKLMTPSGQPVHLQRLLLRMANLTRTPTPKPLCRSGLQTRPFGSRRTWNLNTAPVWRCIRREGSRKRILDFSEQLKDQRRGFQAEPAQGWSLTFPMIEARSGGPTVLPGSWDYLPALVSSGGLEWARSMRGFRLGVGWLRRSWRWPPPQRRAPERLPRQVSQVFSR
jgi:hypothetical protein